MAQVEAKLGKSLDSIIEENRTKVGSRDRGDRGGSRASKPRPKGIRVDGARAKVVARRPLGSRQRDEDAPTRRATARGGAGNSNGLGVQRAGIRKRAPARSAAYDYDEEMEDAEYGMGRPQRRARGAGYDRGAGGGGAPRAQREVRVPRGAPDGQWSHDLFDDSDRAAPRRMLPRGGPLAGRLGGGGRTGASSATLRVSNLDYKVTKEDIQELFGTCGQVVSSEIVYDTSGRSEGAAVVVFARREDAEKAIKEYNGVKLDGQDLLIEFDESTAPAGNVMRLASGRSVERPAAARANGAPGMGFRRAMHDTLGAGGGRAAAGGGGARAGGGGGYGGAGRGRLRSGVVARTMRSKADLDADMDNFMQE